MNKFFQINRKFIIAFVSSFFIVIIIYFLSNLLFVEKNKFDKSNFKPERSELYQIIRIIDGDTIIVNINSQDKTVRLIGINTPEVVDPRRPVECFGIEASNKAKEILSGERVRLESDNNVSNEDRYGRLLRYVFLEDGTNFNEVMIRDGYAYEYTYQAERYKYQNEFKSAESYAKKTKKGLWSNGICER